jgi:hypothetical protein
MMHIFKPWKTARKRFRNPNIKQKHEQDMDAMRKEMNQQVNQIMSTIKQNAQLAFIKPEALTQKTVEHAKWEEP